MVYKTKGVCAQGIEFEIDKKKKKKTKKKKKNTTKKTQVDVPEILRALPILQKEWMQMK